MAPVHNRMPVIQEPRDYPRWLDSGGLNSNDLASRGPAPSFPAEKMIAWPVGSRVGNVRNNDRSCLNPLSLLPSFYFQPAEPFAAPPGYDLHTSSHD